MINQATFNMRVLLPFLVLLYSFEARGQDCGLQDYDSETQPDFNCPGPGEADLRVDLRPPASISVRQGVSVIPLWDGALVHRDRLVEVGLNLAAVRRLRWLDRLRLREEFAIEQQYQDQLAGTRLHFAEQQRDTYQERALAAERAIQSSNPWWRSPVLWFSVGMVVSGALVALTGYALSSI